MLPDGSSLRRPRHATAASPRPLVASWGSASSKWLLSPSVTGRPQCPLPSPVAPRILYGPLNGGRLERASSQTTVMRPCASITTDGEATAALVRETSAVGSQPPCGRRIATRIPPRGKATAIRPPGLIAMS